MQLQYKADPHVNEGGKVVRKDRTDFRTEKQGNATSVPPGVSLEFMMPTKKSGYKTARPCFACVIPALSKSMNDEIRPQE
jgi:hypothetical protein